ncbi:histidine kinase [Corynebacterium striatum]|uniref:histidine kinase n=1 Tax=Corynebacterium striatum TaxID=43770 RepID=UPI0026C6A15F
MVLRVNQSLRWDNVPPDLLASAIWAVFPATAVLIGHVLHRIITQRRDLIEQWNNDVRTRRETLARTLHDSVATSLTSVIRRAETLSIKQGIEADTQAELAAMAAQARDSMKEVRDLLRILNNDSPPRSSDSEPSVANQLYQIANFLKTHGFTVETAGASPSLLFSADSLVILREIPTETATNIIKYAEPRSTVNLTIEDHGGHVTISFVNAVSSSTQNLRLATGLSLPTISRLAENLGGSIRTVSSSVQWETKMRKPQ